MFFDKFDEMMPSTIIKVGQVVLLETVTVSLRQFSLHAVQVFCYVGRVVALQCILFYFMCVMAFLRLKMQNDRQKIFQ